MIINIMENGNIECLYTDEINLAAIGELEISRASEVEFDNERQGWMVNILKDGRKLGPYKTRRMAILFEREYLEERMVD